LKNAYKLIYRSGNNMRQAIEVLRSEIGSEAGRALLAFLEAPSERGILK
jgi:acyl-[acyl carrier protein]--UDP-N-acetylglucosamine O-acyltransferase